MNNENQNIEYKSVWKDEYLKWICGFANSKGGNLYIGVDDTGNILGIKNHTKLLKDIPNKIKDILGIQVEVNLLSDNDKFYIEIKIEPYSNPISYQGRFYVRSGSTIQELKGNSLEKLLLKKIGRRWDSISADGFTMEDLSKGAINSFRKKASKSKRVPSEDINESDENLIKLLGLTNNTELKRAAIIAFGKNPEQLITGAYVKIGFFRTHSDLLYQDEVHGSLFEQVEKTMDLLTTKYMRANIAYEGLTRTETYDYPEEALREALLNALVHKDYSSSNPVQISVYKDWMMIYNNGELPDNWTVETLTEKHTSEPANPDLAKIFFRAGYIEIWGRGIRNTIDYCINAGLPEPYFRKMGPGLTIVFEKKSGNSNFGIIKDVNSQETTLKTSEKTSEKILEAIFADKRITIFELARKLGKTTRAIEMSILKLKSDEKLKRIGSDKTGYWKLKNTLRVSERFGKNFGTIRKEFRNDFSPDELRTLQLVSDNPSITAREVAEELNKSARTIENYISKFRKMKVIKRVGPKLGGYWEIIEK